MENLDTLYGCKRCPTCHSEPKLTVEESDYDHKDTFFLRCAEHGHVAAGDDPNQVVRHWNMYINHVESGKAA